MNQSHKWWWAASALLAPLVIAPVAIVASCATTASPLQAAVDALNNDGIKFVDGSGTYNEAQLIAYKNNPQTFSNQISPKNTTITWSDYTLSTTKVAAKALPTRQGELPKAQLEVEIEVASKTDSTLSPLKTKTLMLEFSFDANTSASPEVQAAAALENAKAYLERQAKYYIGSKPSDFEFSPTNDGVFTMLPSTNYGYTTTISGAKGQDAKNDDAKGTKTVTIKVEKQIIQSDPKVDAPTSPTLTTSSQSTDVSLSGFLTTAQATNEASETKLKVADYINLDKINGGGVEKPFADQAAAPLTIRKATVYVKDAKDSEKAPAFTSANIAELTAGLTNKDKSKVEKYLDLTISSDLLDPASTIGYKSLIKSDQSPLTKDNFKWSNIKASQNGSIMSPTLSADLQLVDGDKESGIVKVEFVGWKLDDTYQDQLTPLFKGLQKDFGTTYHPIIQDGAHLQKLTAEQVAKDDKYWSPFTGDQGNGILRPDWDKVGGDFVMPFSFQATIEDHSQFDALAGSITLKIKLTYQPQPGTTKSGEQPQPFAIPIELTVYGFQVANPSSN